MDAELAGLALGGQRGLHLEGDILGRDYGHMEPDSA